MRKEYDFSESINNPYCKAKSTSIAKCLNKRTIEELFANYTGQYEAEEIDWGQEVGNEVILDNFDNK